MAMNEQQMDRAVLQALAAPRDAGAPAPMIRSEDGGGYDHALKTVAAGLRLRAAGVLPENSPRLLDLIEAALLPDVLGRGYSVPPEEVRRLRAVPTPSFVG
jgi:hypothetical protein